MAVKLSEEALEKLCMGFSKGSDEGFSFGPSKLAIMEENVKRAKKSNQWFFIGLASLYVY